MNMMVQMIVLGAMAATGLVGASETVIKRNFVPSAERRHGEVRLLRQDDRLVLQTLLYSRLLRRVVATIARKERQLWNVETRHHEDAEAYIAALNRALEANVEVDREGRRKLLIEFILSPKLSLIVLSMPTFDEAEDPIRITRRQELTVLVLTREYITDAIREISKDSFAMDDAEADKCLLPLFEQVKLVDQPLEREP